MFRARQNENDDFIRGLLDNVSQKRTYRHMKLMNLTLSGIHKCADYILYSKNHAVLMDAIKRERRSLGNFTINTHESNRMLINTCIN